MELALQSAPALAMPMAGAVLQSPQSQQAAQKPTPTGLLSGPRPADNATAGIVAATQIMSQFDRIGAALPAERTLKPYGIAMLPPRNLMANLS